MQSGTVQDMEKPQKFHQMGAKTVAIKGETYGASAVDVVLNGKEFLYFSSPRINTIHTHGAECTFATAVAVELTRNLDIRVAIQKAKDFITASITNFIPLGKGRGPVNPSTFFAREGEMYRAIQALQRAIKKLQSYPIGLLIPEVQSNLGYAIFLRQNRRRTLLLFRAGLFALKTASMSSLRLSLEDHSMLPISF